MESKRLDLSDEGSLRLHVQLVGQFSMCGVPHNKSPTNEILDAAFSKIVRSTFTISSMSPLLRSNCYLYASAPRIRRLRDTLYVFTSM